MIASVIRWFYRTLLPEGLKNTLRLYLLFDEHDKPPVLIDSFDQRQVLVLAPHMDDEIIGCGGALCFHAEAGSDVTIAFLTDGSCGHPQQLTPEQRQALTATRKEESRRAAACIGVHELVFFDQPDGKLRADQSIVKEVKKLIEAQQPEVIYIPSMLDVHHDHWATNSIFYQALKQIRGDAVLCREFEAWTPLLANRIVDITAAMDRKVEALRAFDSQNRWVDYARTTQGLNTYRSVHNLGGAGFAEAFYESTPQGYAAKFERFEQRK